ncbi:MAG: hypothetical protein ACLR7D_16850 [Lachnospira eligens]
MAILIGVKNGTLDKLTKEMPTLATNQAETEKATVNARNNSTESKPYDGIEVAEYGEEFVIRRKIDGRKYDENDRTTYNIYHVKELMIARYRDSVILILTGWILDWIIRKKVWMKTIILYQIFIMQQ